MLTVVTDPDVIREALSLYPLHTIDLDVEEWIKGEVLVFSDDAGNIGIFEEFTPSVYTAHYFYKSARGRAAIDLSNALVAEMVNNHDMKIVRGLISVDHKPSIWMARHLGMKEYDRIETIYGPYIVFMMTTEEWKNK